MPLLFVWATLGLAYSSIDAARLLLEACAKVVCAPQLSCTTGSSVGFVLCGVPKSKDNKQALCVGTYIISVSMQAATGGRVPHIVYRLARRAVKSTPTIPVREKPCSCMASTSSYATHHSSLAGVV